MNTRKLCNEIKKHTPAILSIVGGVGVIFTAIASAKDTPKALRLIEEKKKEEERELTKTEKFKCYIKGYTPTIIIGTITVGSILASELLNIKSQKDLSGVISILGSSYQTYRQKVEQLPETAEERKEREFKQTDDDDYILVYDGFFKSTKGDEFFRVRPSDIINGLYEVNKAFAKYGCCSSYDLYSSMMIDEQLIPKEYEQLGWDIIDQELDFMSTDDGIPWINYYYSIAPRIIEGGNEVMGLFFSVDPIAIM